MYWFPMKAVQSAAYVSMLACPSGAFYVPFNFMLFALYLMQVYWFTLIVKLLIKVGSAPFLSEALPSLYTWWLTFSVTYMYAVCMLSAKRRLV